MYYRKFNCGGGGGENRTPVLYIATVISTCLEIYLHQMSFHQVSRVLSASTYYTTMTRPSPTVDIELGHGLCERVCAAVTVTRILAN